MASRIRLAASRSIARSSARASGAQMTVFFGIREPQFRTHARSPREECLRLSGWRRGLRRAPQLPPPRSAHPPPARWPASARRDRPSLPADERWRRVGRDRVGQANRVRTAYQSRHPWPVAVPNGTGNQYQYYDLGVNIDCHDMREVLGQLTLTVSADISAVALESATASSMPPRDSSVQMELHGNCAASEGDANLLVRRPRFQT